MNTNTLLDCDNLEAEAQQNMDVLNDAKSVLLTFANDLKALDAQLESSEASNYSEVVYDVMKGLIANGKRVERSLLAAKQTLEMNDEVENEDDDLVDFTSCFEQKLQQLNSKINYNNDKKFQELTKILSTETETDDLELETMETAPFRIPTDPFMKKQVDFPVKNKRCGHVYDKTYFKQYLDMCANNPRKLICPIGGCQNKERLTESSVEDDIELRFKIRRAKSNN